MTVDAKPGPSFLEELHTQRWDDHRFYHQSRVNQSLHLMSAFCFWATYALIPFYPLYAALLGWIVAMWVRQIGHFFFEPKGFDTVNGVSFEEKERIKVGFNLQRKVILLVVWCAIPATLYASPTLFGLLSEPAGRDGLMDRIGWAWLLLAAAGLLARTLYLMVTQNFQTGAVWFTKILTDPYHDIKMYWQSPYHLLRGQRLDPMEHVSHQGAEPAGP
jgi:hypothetical protein